MKQSNRLNFTFRVEKDGKVINKCHTHSIRRFYHRIGTINWQSKPSKVYLRVSYGRGLNNFGKMANFYNDGDYTTKHDLIFALKAFTEPGLVKDFI